VFFVFAPFFLFEAPFDLAVTLRRGTEAFFFGFAVTLRRGAEAFFFGLDLTAALAVFALALGDFFDFDDARCLDLANRSKARTSSSFRMACQPATPCFFAFCARSFLVYSLREAAVINGPSLR